MTWKIPSNRLCVETVCYPKKFSVSSMRYGVYFMPQVNNNIIRTVEKMKLN